MEQEPKIENKEKKKISKIHFLIHPGWLYQGGVRYLETINLLNSYLEKARSLGGDELMFAVLHESRESMKQDAKSEGFYMQTIRKLRDILGDRLIVVSDPDFNILTRLGILARLSSPRKIDVRKERDKIKRIIEARGYQFDKDVLSEAYGELMNQCVATGARNLNVTLGLKKKTIIKTGLTDAASESSTSRSVAEKKELVQWRWPGEFEVD